jgi:hypothetical protein
MTQFWKCVKERASASQFKTARKQHCFTALKFLANASPLFFQLLFPLTSQLESGFRASLCSRNSGKKWHFGVLQVMHFSSCTTLHVQPFWEKFAYQNPRVHLLANCQNSSLTTVFFSLSPSVCRQHRFLGGRGSSSISKTLLSLSYHLVNIHDIPIYIELAFTPSKIHVPYFSKHRPLLPTLIMDSTNRPHAAHIAIWIPSI